MPALPLEHSGGYAGRGKRNGTPSLAISASGGKPGCGTTTASPSFALSDGNQNPRPCAWGSMGRETKRSLCACGVQGCPARAWKTFALRVIRSEGDFAANAAGVVPWAEARSD